MKISFKITVFILFFTGFFSCTCDEEKKYTLSSSENGIVEISNNGKESATFSMIVNGQNLNSQKNIVAFIKSVNQDSPDESIEMTAFRFVCNYTWHDVLLTKNNWAYSPYILVNSLGGGLCGFRSSVLTNILKDLGFKARSWGLNGHVVTEVYVGGKWILLDPDLGVYYFNSKKEIASFEELCSNPRLVTNPVNPILEADDRNYSTAYSNKTAELYSSRNDNFEFNTDFDSELKNIELKFFIPAGSILTFPYNDKYCPGFYSIAELSLPQTYTGKLAIPLIIKEISGNGTVRYLNKTYKISEFNVQANIFENARVSMEIEIVENLGDIKIQYYINPIVFNFYPSSEIILQGCNLDLVDIKFSERKDIHLILSNEKDLLYNKIYFYLNDLNDSLVQCNTKLDSTYIDKYMRLFVNKCMGDADLARTIDFTELNMDLDSLIFIFPKTGLAGSSLYYNPETATPLLRKLLFKYRL